MHDDFLRLLFVEYEPTWEWRFVKEVFHRDKLVGERGFRTFLRSADPRVRETNELFLPTLTPPRSEFFAYDVIILGDMPAAALSPGFCQMTERVRRTVRRRAGRAGRPALRPRPAGRYAAGRHAAGGHRSACAPARPPAVPPRARPPMPAQYDFMQLGADAVENQQAWENLGPLPWYQPVERLQPLATALAVHPSDRCVDGEKRSRSSPRRNYGRGEVVYVGFNEIWRLRRKFGEQYYRQFWGQLIHRLALRHALGLAETVRGAHRPRASTRPTSRSSSPSRPTTPISSRWPKRTFPAASSTPSSSFRKPARSTLPARARCASPQLRQGVYEARVPVFAAGEHRVRVKDPVTGEFAETAFRVINVSAERQRSVRNTALAETLAAATGGKNLRSGDRRPTPRRDPGGRPHRIQGRSGSALEHLAGIRSGRDLDAG